MLVVGCSEPRYTPWYGVNGDAFIPLVSKRRATAALVPCERCILEKRTWWYLSEDFVRSEKQRVCHAQQIETKEWLLERGQLEDASRRDCKQVHSQYANDLRKTRPRMLTRLWW